MHFLCLHGRGTNAKIFEMQTAAIRYELGDRHTYDFVEGNIPYEMEPGVRGMLASDEQTWAYFKEDDPDTALTAINDLEKFVGINGPYDGVVSFSQAAGLIGTWSINRCKQGKPSFKCAIFLSAASPAIEFDSLREGRVVLATKREVIGIPTAHIWGVTDPYAEVARDFGTLCKEDVKSVYVHGGGHEIPSSKDAVTSMVNIIRRAILLGEE